MIQPVLRDVLRDPVAGGAVDVIPFLAGQSDIGGREAVGQAPGVGRAGDRHDMRGMAQEPGDDDGIF